MAAAAAARSMARGVHRGPGSARPALPARSQRPQPPARARPRAGCPLLRRSVRSGGVAGGGGGGSSGVRAQARVPTEQVHALHGRRAPCVALQPLCQPRPAAEKCGCFFFFFFFCVAMKRDAEKQSAVDGAASTWQWRAALHNVRAGLDLHAHAAKPAAIAGCSFSRHIPLSMFQATVMTRTKNREI